MKKNLKKAMAMGLATTMALAAPAAVSAAGDTSDVSGLIWSRLGKTAQRNHRLRQL